MKVALWPIYIIHECIFSIIINKKIDIKASWLLDRRGTRNKNTNYICKKLFSKFQGNLSSKAKV